MKPASVIAQRIEERIATLRAAGVDMSARKLSLMLFGHESAITNIKRGRMPNADHLQRIAGALDTSIAYLTGEIDEPAPTHITALAAPSPTFRLPQGERRDPALRTPNTHRAPEDWRRWVRDLPVIGTALGGAFDLDRRVELTTIHTGEVLDYMPRPPALSSRRQMYVVYCAGDSMQPLFDPGEPLLIDPTRPVAPGNVVIIQLAAPNGHDGEQEVVGGLVKRLVRRMAGGVRLEQFNPPLQFDVPSARIQAMHRVMKWWEAMQ